MAQNYEQAQLLQDAYLQHSTEKLYEFFDNWAAAVRSNEKEAPNPYVAEAHKVFAAFYQPLYTIDGSKHLALYKHKPYFIVQSSLHEILQAEKIFSKPEEIDSFMVASIYREFPNDTSLQNHWIKEVRSYKIGPAYDSYDFPRFARIPTTKLDSAIEFRPPVSFKGKKVVYLTQDYVELLDDFLNDTHIDLGEEDIMQPAYSSDNSQLRHEFFNKAALIFYGHWGGYWQYETYPQAYKIIFNKEMDRAIVTFRFVYEGGKVILEKQDGKWKIVDACFTWIE